MPDPRPRDLSPSQVGFVRQRPVPWLNPGLLAGTAVRVLFAHLFGGYLDKRELQAAFPGRTHDWSDRDELWLDYTADVGDGFDATYSVAYLLSQDRLDVPEQGPLPRGDLLVLGGDQVYPTASASAYQNRWKGPYRAALPEPEPTSPVVYALPGNHDWYDGLTAFLRLFGQRDQVGGWRTEQARSYFALALPHRWWLFAIDVQLTSYIDEPQLEYFRAAAQDVRPGDRIILCTAKPGWVQTFEDPGAYDNIDYFIRTIIEPTGARIPLLLAGDMHHYARYTEADPDGPRRELLTCGGGGAYLVGTDHLPVRIDAPPPTTTVRKASPSREYELAAAYPSQTRSRRLGWRILSRLPLRNPGLILLLGFIQTLLMLAIVAADGRWVDLSVVTAAGVVLGGTLLFSLGLGQRGRRQWVAGLLHALPHIGLGIAGAEVWSALPPADLAAPWNTLLAFVLYLPVVGVVDSWIVAAYLIVARYATVNVNELYAGLGIEDYKTFLRMRVGPDGSLTIFPIAVERVCRHWRADPAGQDGAPWIAPVDPLEVKLVEPPITLT